MAWYTILFITSFLLFIGKLILSWVAGDFEMDVDLDGADDFDSSSAFSFKGFLHFLMGASSYLFLRSTTTSIEKIDGIAQFGIFDYALATFCGIMLVIILYFGYKIAIKANQKPLTPLDLINNANGIIYINLGNGNYSVQAHTSAGTTNITASSDDLNMTSGTNVKIINDNGKFIIKKINNV